VVLNSARPQGAVRAPPGRDNTSEIVLEIVAKRSAEDAGLKSITAISEAASSWGRANAPGKTPLTGNVSGANLQEQQRLVTTPPQSSYSLGMAQRHLPRATRNASTPAVPRDSPRNYGQVLAAMKERIQAAQLRAGLAVNRELVWLYWQIGNDILENQKRLGWGAKVVDRLSRDLSHAFP
jgi:hypothetical protein